MKNLRSLFHRKNLMNLCLTAVNQVIGVISNKVPNGIARSMIDLSYVFMKNVPPSSVWPTNLPSTTVVQSLRNVKIHCHHPLNVNDLFLHIE